jgi:hypothetical protein
MSGVDLVIGELEPTTVEADPRELARHLFRCFLRAFDAARGGGAVHVHVWKVASLRAEVTFTPMPPVGSGRVASEPIRWTMPVVTAPLRGGDG